MKRSEYKRCLKPIATVSITFKGLDGWVIRKNTLLMIKDLPYKKTNQLYGSCIGRKKSPVRLTRSIYKDLANKE